MKRTINLFLLIFCLVFLTSSLFATGATKRVDVGSIQNIVMDWGPQLGGYWQNLWYEYDDFANWNQWFGIWGLGVKNWTDENGEFYESFDHVESEDGLGAYIWAVEFEPGMTIKRTFRHVPVARVVNDAHLEEPFPRYADFHDPDRIPGTADVMIESHIRTRIGVDVKQTVLAWSQANHDDYIIYDWTFINTGNVDLDDEIELPNQTLEDLYVGRNFEAHPNSGGYHAWHSKIGEHPDDPLRMLYAYPSRKSGSSKDDYGNMNVSTGFPNKPAHVGLLTAHASKSAQDQSNDPAQPQMTANFNPWQTCVSRWGTYQRMVEGFKPEHSIPYMHELGDDVYPNTHHHPRMDDVDYWGTVYPSKYEWFNWIIASTMSYGPYNLAPGDSIRIVTATVMGSIDTKTGWKIGRAWIDGTAADTWDGDWKLPPAWEKGNLAPTDNDKAKDSWITTGKDSLFNNGLAAIWAVENDYQVPIPPPAPSIEVQGRADRIRVSWGDESEAVADFAGYRVYRAEGAPHYSEQSGVVVGDWQKVFECGQGTENALTHVWDDIDAERGVAYYYYVTAFDDGTHPEVPAAQRGGVNGIPESLESGKYLTRLIQPAYLAREAGQSLSDIRIVPNPYNISARAIQYTGEADKIAFLNLPPECTIRIYTESGDLVKTIKHTDGSGDDYWVDPTGEHFMTSDNQQIPVSGLYIANFTTPEGKSHNMTFYIIR